ncbi:schwannomin-interacting protein 1 isoform X2 [Brienomyrus brachyistius]|uniref:schwannomin-interacting protein 1 isoform X2 n=1 Tax=Brienomyrus brachyistius TaxID=42636 RepID=UPI0020B360AD|nr:schwannomin-interacting protein 1 isoform X2 [Brienomyrus brachyistius]
MEGEKERERERREEKESDEAEDFGQAVEGAATVWQEGINDDDLGLPIMHWEALSLRIAELEKQEEEKREKYKEQECVSGGWRGERERGCWRDAWDDGEEECNSRIIALTSRLQNRMNLQLCFINNSESEEEDEDEAVQQPLQAGHRPPAPVSGSKSGGLKQEVRAALSALRDKLRIEQKEKESPTSLISQCAECCETPIKRKKLDLSDLQNLSLQQLDALRISLTQNVHDLSSELVGRLLTRDQLRTEQDAMLLEVQDMTL